MSGQKQTVQGGHAADTAGLFAGVYDSDGPAKSDVVTMFQLPRHGAAIQHDKDSEPLSVRIEEIAKNPSPHLTGLRRTTGSHSAASALGKKDPGKGCDLSKSCLAVLSGGFRSIVSVGAGEKDKGDKPRKSLKACATAAPDGRGTPFDFLQVNLCILMHSIIFSAECI